MTSRQNANQYFEAGQYTDTLHRELVGCVADVHIDKSEIKRYLAKIWKQQETQYHQ